MKKHAEQSDEALCELEGRQRFSSSALRLRLLPGVGSEMTSAARGVPPWTIAGVVRACH